MDTSTYESFVRSMWPQAVRTCWLILRNREDAEEAAKAAGWTLGTYKWRLAKARRRLGDLLKEEKPMGYLLSEELVGNG